MQLLICQKKPSRSGCRGNNGAGVAERYEIIYQALTAPRKAEDIAKSVGVSLATVHQVISRYKRRGVAAIETPGKGGRRRQYLTLEQERAFLQPFLARAYEGEQVTVTEVQQAYEEVVKQPVALTTIYRLLQRHGWRLRKVSSRPASVPQISRVQEESVAVHTRKEQASPPTANWVVPPTVNCQRTWHRSQSYPSDLTNEQWAILEPLIPPAKPGGRPRSVDMREVLNAIFYVDRTGCQWRALPHDFPRLPYRLELLSPMARRWHVGAHPYGIARAGAGEARS
jgi:transposase